MAKPSNENIFFKDDCFPVRAQMSKRCLQTPPARHPQPEIKYFTEGECVIVLDGQTITARAGDVVIISPFQRHYTYTNGEVCKYHLLNFDLNFLKSDRICKIDTDFLIPFQDGRLIIKPHLRVGDRGYNEAIDLFRTLEEDVGANGS
jgi:hypothetical protein